MRHVFGPRGDGCLVTTDRTMNGDFCGGYTDNQPKDIAVVNAFEKQMITMVQDVRRTLFIVTVLAMMSTSPARQSRRRAEEYRTSVQAANRNFSTNAQTVTTGLPLSSWRLQSREQYRGSWDGGQYVRRNRVNIQKTR